MNIQKMMKQAQEMQAKIQQAQADIEALEIEGTSGGGAVKLKLTGKGQLLSVSIADGAMGDRETLEDLILAAHNDAKGKIDEATASSMSAVTGGLNLPAGLKLPF